MMMEFLRRLFGPGPQWTDHFSFRDGPVMRRRLPDGSVAVRQMTDAEYVEYREGTAW